MLKSLKGVGAKTAEKLNKLGLFSPRDIAEFLPSAYIDMSKLSDSSDLVTGDYALIKVLIDEVKPYRLVRKGLGMINANGYIDGEKIYLTWFNNPYIADKLSKDEFYFYGKIGEYKGNIAMTNPAIKGVGECSQFRPIEAIYPLKDYVSQANFRKIVEDAIEKCEITNFLAGREIKIDYIQAHFPPSMESMYKAQRRLMLNRIVQDLLEYRKSRADLITVSKKPKIADISEFLARLPFKLSQSQMVALGEIQCDLASSVAMNRLLLGDVGSGKTVVATAVLYHNCLCGYQGAFMAPTEVLATQQYNTITRLMSPLGIKVVKLSGEIKGAERKSILKQIESGDGQIVVGTHSCISDDVIYNNFGLAVIDELHKFGVKQRAQLLAKGQNCDCLVMSATPIPRTIAMTLYGDLQVSKLDLRENQQRVSTYIMRDDKLNGFYNYLLSKVASGEQAFIICPKVEDSDGLELMSAKALYENLSKGIMKGINISLIHGKMSAVEKNAIMESFSQNNTSVLVATSLVEVGIDIPNATVMGIIAADCFGLSSLHQLRGRVGRGEKKGECYLHVRSKEVPERIKAMREYSDGIKLSEIDAELRGLGDFIGSRQSGKSGYERYKISLTPNMIKEAKSYADRVEINAIPTNSRRALEVLFN